MKVATTKERILGAALLAERITGKKESLPVLSCVLLEAKDELIIKATNLEAGIEITLPSGVQEVGVVAVPAAVLSQTLRSISGDKLQLKIDESNLEVSARGTRTLIKAVPHEEFPLLGEVNKRDSCRVSREGFLQALQMVSYAASPSMIRPELGSVFISMSEGVITCVATDSFRLAEKRIPSAGTGDVELLLPLKHAQELVYVLEYLKEEVVMLFTDESQVVVEGGGIRYLSRVVDGTFPNYKELIPKQFTTEATLLKNDLTETLRKARIFSGNDQHVGLHVYPARKIFSSTARSADIGEVSDTVDASLSGDDLDINFHIGYLGDCLSSIESDSVTLGFSGPGRPLVIRGVNNDSFTYLVMPLNR